ncbi:MAG: hypothetical protein ACRDPL_08465 [Propionibacteriaceae bacterium]
MAPVSEGLAAEARRGLRLAGLGSTFARYTRSEATQLERDAARIARAAGMPVAEIADEMGVSVPMASATPLSERD